MPDSFKLESDHGDEMENSTAFQVINEDVDLNKNIILPQINNINAIKPLQDNENRTINKPNLVVYPIRRFPQENETNETNPELFPHKKILSKSNPYLAKKQSENNKKQLSQSYCNLKNFQNMNITNAEFSQKLDQKLKMLQMEERLKKIGSSARLNISRHDGDDFRKPFVTVVKKGKFLKPPPEIATKLLLEPYNEEDERNEKVLIAKKMYAYVSRPKILNRNEKSGDSRISKLSGRSFKKSNIDSFESNESINQMTRFKRDLEGYWKLQQNEVQSYGNIMYDKRVHRGNTYALHPLPMREWNPNFTNAKSLTVADGESEAARQAEARRRALARKRIADKKAYHTRLRLGSPPPVPGRKHEEMQTDKYLEEIFENPPKVNVICQTDLFLDRPKSPFYAPIKVGVDVETQILPGELFDFDVEVQPILELLVGKTIEQSLIEVLEEEELAALREQQRRFEEIRNAETSETQRLEERERRYRQEKERRVNEHLEGAKIQQETEERVAASVLAQGYLENLLPNVLEGLKEDGILVEEIKQDLGENFMPWLTKEVSSEMEQMVLSREVLSDIVREIIETRHEIYKAVGEKGFSPEYDEANDDSVDGGDSDLKIEELEDNDVN